jgi:hypothetical protein
MSTQTLNTTQIAPLMRKLEVAREISQQEHRAALKLKLRNKLQERGDSPLTNNHPLFKDPSGNDALLLAAKRSLIREHIAKVAIMKQVGMETIPPFSEVWENYLERNSSNHSHEGHSHEGHCTTSSCGCGSNH